MVRGTKWEKFFQMPFQEMDDKEFFSHLDLSWNKVQCKGGKKDLVATIPIGRLNDFKKGEEHH